jgi:hypothetical protein
MDLLDTTLAGLVAIGVVNVITMWKPALSSQVKFGIAFVVAFLVLFIPPDLGNIILEKAKIALEVAFASSGVYKLAQKVGGD